MAIFKCKMCGGNIEFEPGATVGVCDSCGTKQTLPRLDDDQRANLYDRANHFRRNNEFDKAAGIYEHILEEDNTDAEAYWSLLLCRYGIEYVEDPSSHKRIPTVNRAQYTSIFDDENYKSALHYADGLQREIYEEEAKTINEIQKGILAISQKEEPFDIFICYKETDSSGRRTMDSVIATDMYNQLTQEGYKVFFSRITLEDKLGIAYEPYIFAALNSAKIMIAIGTKKEHFDSAWVRNEWSRYLALVKQSAGKKMLIPAYKDMDPYDLPEEFSHLQALDMSKLGFMQDLLRGISKILDSSLAPQVTNTVTSGAVDTDAYKKRIRNFLAEKDFKSAKEYCNKVLDINPEDGEAYLYLLCAELEADVPESLKSLNKSFENNSSYKNALKYCSQEECVKLSGYLESAKQNEKKKKSHVKRAIIIASVAVVCVLIATAGTLYLLRQKKLSKMMVDIRTYAENDEFTEASNCITDYDEARKRDSELVDYVEAGNLFNEEKYEEAKEIFDSISGYIDSSIYIQKCEYYIFENEYKNMTKAEAKRKYDELIERQIEDVDNIGYEIKYQYYEEMFSYRYEIKNYDGCIDVIKIMDKEIRDEFIEKNFPQWYEDLKKEIFDCYNNTTNLKGLGKLAEYNSSYKNTYTYLEVVRALNKAYIERDTLFKYLTYPCINCALWKRYSGWLEGTWKTKNGDYYFTLKEDGHINYNLPWIDMENSYYAIDEYGILYLYGQYDKGNYEKRMDLFDFDIVSSTELEVYCYKDGSRHTLFKQ